MFFYDTGAIKEAITSAQARIAHLESQVRAKERAYQDLRYEFGKVLEQARELQARTTLAAPAPTTTTEALVLDLRERVQALEGAASAEVTRRANAARYVAEMAAKGHPSYVKRPAAYR